MQKIYLICGFIGSGKTVYSRELADRESAFRFSVDEWMIPLFGEHMSREEFDARLDTLTNLFKAAAEQMIGLKVPVIFDFGFWYKKQRRQMKEWAESIGAEPEFIYLDTPYKVCRTRAFERNKQGNQDSYNMNDEMLQLFWSWFETPDNDEIVTVIKS